MAQRVQMDFTGVRGRLGSRRCESRREKARELRRRERELRAACCEFCGVPSPAQRFQRACLGIAVVAFGVFVVLAVVVGWGILKR